MTEPAQVTVLPMSADALRSLVREAVREELKTNASDDDVLDLEDVARLLKISTKTVVKYINKRGLPATRFGQNWRFRRDNVRSWLQEQAVKFGAPSERYGDKLRAVKGEG
ncbi:helix-turn-helix domain-containing protein [Pendulispora brunnea]|uniref:Helix-turn-helix domain-containing protein n=1 Tax=Pendulispora brunnea TaxID=2905690 RepID=A0ABZ2KH38_9BACT